MRKHIGLDLSLINAPDKLVKKFLEAVGDKVEVDYEGRTKYILKDETLIFYYDVLCSNNIVESLKARRDRMVLDNSDLKWFVEKLRGRQAGLLEINANLETSVN